MIIEDSLAYWIFITTGYGIGILMFATVVFCYIQALKRFHKVSFIEKVFLVLGAVSMFIFIFIY